MSVDTQTEAWLANREERRHDDVEEALRADHLEIATSGSFGAYHYCHCGRWSTDATETFVEHVVQETRDLVAHEIWSLQARVTHPTGSAGRSVQLAVNAAFRHAALVASGDV